MGSRALARQESRVPLPVRQLANIHRTIPAGAATAAALPRTKRVRSRAERTKTFPT